MRVSDAFALNPNNLPNNKLAFAGAQARCGHGGRVSVQASPARGCAFRQREPGADDEPGRPESLPVVAPDRGVVLAR